MKNSGNRKSDFTAGLLHPEYCHIQTGRIFHIRTDLDHLVIFLHDSCFDKLNGSPTLVKIYDFKGLINNNNQLGEYIDDDILILAT